MISTQKDKNLIYDVGMHKGEDTDYYLKKGFRVIAFEANPENVAFCAEKYAKEIESGQLTIIEGVISETDEPTVKFFRNPQHSWWGTSSTDFADRNEVMGKENEVIELKSVNFVKQVEKFGIPYYLKADIVGSEKICLRGLLQFENKPDYISIRSEKVDFTQLLEEFSLFEQLGYDKFQAIQQDVPNFYATKDSKEGTPIDYKFQEGSSGIFGKDLSENWFNKENTIKQYRKIFRDYKMFGDYSIFMKSNLGKKLVAILERFAKRPLPGWYDTHAKHSSLQMFVFSLCSTLVYL
ncbi:MAG: FkbM family methyltransferase [Pyrinomonadaceae bacterium]|nr:FkbM family methyltransferase [Pyrinomonadaceae bacterium]